MKGLWGGHLRHPNHRAGRGDGQRPSKISLRSIVGLLVGLVLAIAGSVSLGAAPAVAGGGSDGGSLTYTGQGIKDGSVDQQCDAQNTSYLLFVFTGGSATNVQLHGITVTDTKVVGGSVHFTTPYVDPPSSLIGKVSVTWDGDAGNNPQLVISHGCAGQPQTKTVTPQPPSATPPSCEHPNQTVTPPDQEGVLWDPSGPTVIAPGETALYTASPDTDNGWSFPPDVDHEWAFTNTFDTSNCQPPPTPKPGTATAKCGACSNPDEANGTAIVKVTNTADDTKGTVTYNVTLNGVVKHLTLADGDTDSVTFDGLAPGNYDWSVTGPDGTDVSGTVKVKQCETPPPTTQPGTATAKCGACSNPDEANGTAVVEVTNPNDESETYHVTLNGVEQDLTVAGHDKGSSTFTGLAPGTYDWSVTGPGGTDVSGTVKVKQCETPPPTPETPTAATSVDQCEPSHGPTNDGVNIPADENFTYVDKATGETLPTGFTRVQGTSITVDAVANEGVPVTEGAQTEWTFAFTKVLCHQPPPIHQGKRIKATPSCGQVTFGPNNNGFNAHVWYGKFNLPAPDGKLTLAPGESKTVKTSRHHLDFVAFGHSKNGRIVLSQEGHLTVKQNCGNKPPRHHHHGHQPPKTPTQLPDTGFNAPPAVASTSGGQQHTLAILEIVFGGLLALSSLIGLSNQPVLRRRRVGDR